MQSLDTGICSYFLQRHCIWQWFWLIQKHTYLLKQYAYYKLVALTHCQCTGIHFIQLLNAVIFPMKIAMLFEYYCQKPKRTAVIEQSTCLEQFTRCLLFYSVNEYIHEAIRRVAEVYYLLQEGLSRIATSVVCFSFFFWLRVLDKAVYSAFESTLNSAIVSYRKKLHFLSQFCYRVRVTKNCGVLNCDHFLNKNIYSIERFTSITVTWQCRWFS